MKEADHKETTIVIGAGLGGLAAALILASKGRRVVVLERNSRAGGKMQEYRAAGYRFDTGPSLLTLTKTLKKVFESAGESIDEKLELLPLDPICRYFYRDGIRFDCHRDADRTANEIAGFAPEDREAYKAFLAYSADLFEKTEKAFLQNPLHQLRDLRQLSWSDVFKIDAFQTVSSRVDRSFRSEKVRTFFKRFSTYNGSSPFRAPATLNVIPHVELTLGSYYVRGGLYRIAEALEQSAINKGAEFRYNSEVKAIRIHGGRVCGVELESGEFVPAGLVISNCDASETVLRLMKKKDQSVWTRWLQRRLEPSGSGFVLLLGTNRRWEQLSHHNVFFSGDYRREFQQIFRDRRLPDDPTVYVTNSSLTDPEDAPAEGSNLFILINAPWLTEKQEWDQRKERYASRVIRKLESAGLEGLAASVRFKMVLTPLDFYERYRSNRGSIYGTSSNSRLTAFLRPGNKLRGVDGLYLTGGSTHPGGGIPLVLQSAMHVVELIERFGD